jgi:diacylglycerol O-acyltransferase
MHRLSALDAGFLYLETAETPMNIGTVTVFAPPADSADAVFREFRDHTAARLERLPFYRRRAVMTPLGIDHPVWVEERALDLDYHIRRRALGRPGTMEQLRSLVAELHSVPLDRARPLWQYYLIEGLEGGGFAVYVKLNHADMDGVEFVASLPVIYDPSPEASSLAPPPGESAGETESPSAAQLIGDAFRDFAGQDLRFLRAAPRIATTLTKIGRRAMTTLRLLPAALRLAPKTPLNRSISHRRSYGTASLSLSEAKQVAKARHVTVNDVLLAICGGALSRYLSGRNALPRAPLIAAVPVSLREPGHLEMNNQLGVIFCSLATDVADRLERLAAVAASTQDAKARFSDVKAVWPVELSLLGVPIVVTGVAQLWTRTRAFDALPTMANLLISNIPGPRQPLSCCGARALHCFPVSVPYHGIALNVTAMSYLDNVDLGLTACRAAVPDVQTIADDIAAEFAALKEAVHMAHGASGIEMIDIAAPRDVIAKAAGIEVLDIAEKAPPRPQIEERAVAAAAPSREAIAVSAAPGVKSPGAKRRSYRRAAKDRLAAGQVGKEKTR